MIGWHITLGYNSGHTGDADWQTVCDLAVMTAGDTKSLADEAFIYTRKEPLELREMIEKVAETYQQHDTFGSPLFIDEKQIMILASGGGDWRKAKEHVARAFVRLLMQAVHSLGFDISVSVA
jgi:hypothetical protein